MFTPTHFAASQPPKPSSSAQVQDATNQTLTASAEGNFHQRGLKRKHDELDAHVHIGKPFRIQAQGTLATESITLCPKLLVPRACLPLAYLESSGHGDIIADPRLFAAQRPELEDLLQVKSPNSPVLVAQSSIPNTALYAIERLAKGLYALCKLAEWVTIEALGELDTASSTSRVKRRQSREQMNPHDNDWWRDAAVPKVAGDGRPRSSKASAFLGARLSLKAPRAENSVPVSNISSSELALEPLQASTEMSIEPGTSSPAQPPEEIFSLLRVQYQEALYFSKASLAYFAKGPLSRARALLQSKGHPTAESQLLTAHLRSSVMSLSTMDKKYKEAVPSIVNTLPADVLSEDDVVAVVSEYQKKVRKGKKGRIGKSGLYPGEEADIARWWLTRESPVFTVDTQETNGDAANDSLIDLRARETQLQIILILETLSLEASTARESGEEILVDKITDIGNKTSPKKTKYKKPQDLKVLLDLFIDRLCIWQSMRLDDRNQSQHDHQEAGNQTKGQSDSSNSDALKNFCVDVVLPFYAARLPETTRVLRQKLGGPKTPSPIRPSLAKAASLSHLGRKPGAAIQRPGVKKPTRTLERVLTDEKAASRRRAPILSRSTTDSALPGLKREASDMTLSSIPLNRVALHKSKRYSQREVDLNAVSQAAEAKSKKASIEQELQSAIATLKRPNPRMAVKELVEAAEKRTAGSHARKAKHPVRNPFAQNVQVMATPKGKRQKDAYGANQPPQPFSEAIPEPDEIPPSSAPRVPSSVQRSTIPRTKEIRPALPNMSFHPTIEQTPTRGPSKYNNVLAPSACNSDISQLCTPLKSSRSGNLSTPYQHDLHYYSAREQSSRESPLFDAAHVKETPEKHPAKLSAENARAPNTTAIASSPPVGANETSTSIYDALGWNDDFDELS